MFLSSTASEFYEIGEIITLIHNVTIVLNWKTHIKCLAQYEADTLQNTSDYNDDNNNNNYILCFLCHTTI